MVFYDVSIYDIDDHGSLQITLSRIIMSCNDSWEKLAECFPAGFLRFWILSPKLIITQDERESLIYLTI